MTNPENYKNQAKYWNYRQRLKQFVYVSASYNEAGTNIPAECISEDNSTISWDDGNGAFNQYISMLATEYRLLKNDKQDYRRTIQELYYALKSFERLDWSADALYREDKSRKPGDLNGFFLRNDVNSTFWNTYKKDGSNPYFTQTQASFDPPMPNSLDNCIHYLESFALVNALVDNETVDGIDVDFKQIAKDAVDRMIQNMQHPDEPIPVVDFPALKGLLSYTWYLKNPVTKEPIPIKYGSGLDGTMLYASYGFTKAANRILGAKKYKEMRFSHELSKFLLSHCVTDNDFELEVKRKIGVLPIPLLTFKDYNFYITLQACKVKVLHWPWFPIIAKTLTSKTKVWDIGQDDYKMRSLCATGNIDIVKHKSPYEVLIQKQFESSQLKYEHLPLLWSVLMNNFSYITERDRRHVKYLLDLAPEEGPYKFNKGDSLQMGHQEWSSPSRLVWPERLGACNKPVTGHFNGLDYMLLHNLYLLSGGTF